MTLGKVVAVSAPHQQVHSRLVQCGNNFCNERVPFTLLAAQQASSACPSCGGTLTENCRERAMYAVKHIGLRLQRSSSGASSLGRNLIVRLEDDLAEARLHLGQTLRLVGFLTPGAHAECALSKVHGFHSAQVIFECLGVDTRCRIAQLKENPPLPSFPCYLPGTSSLESAAEHLHALAWSFLPGMYLNRFRYTCTYTYSMTSMCVCDMHVHVRVFACARVCVC